MSAGLSLVPTSVEDTSGAKHSVFRRISHRFPGDVPPVKVRKVTRQDASPLRRKEMDCDGLVPACVRRCDRASLLLRCIAHFGQHHVLQQVLESRRTAGSENGRQAAIAVGATRFCGTYRVSSGEGGVDQLATLVEPPAISGQRHMGESVRLDPATARFPPSGLCAFFDRNAECCGVFGLEDAAAAEEEEEEVLEH